MVLAVWRNGSATLEDGERWRTSQPDFLHQSTHNGIGFSQGAVAEHCGDSNKREVLGMGQ